MTAQQDPAHPGREELRLAPVLNGGVSLAVWMGGVSLEIDRLADGVGGYGAMLDATRSTACVDIIAGTSAGGINGAMLAMSRANVNADFARMRQTWADDGQLEVLLRTPFRGKPTSMLRGDDYFLPELNKAVAALAGSFERRPGVAIDLTITTTLLHGWQETTVDDFGHVIPQTLHAGSFHFATAREQPATRRGTPDVVDDFAPAAVGATTTALALAARATASFPFAFEPAFIPVLAAGAQPSDPLPDPLHGDMRPYANWVDPDDLGDQSRYVVDGGVLDNTPVRHVLRAIDDRQADGPVRRAMVLVFPHAPTAVATPAPDSAEAPPSATEALAGVVGSITAHSGRSYIEEVEEHNRRAGDWVGSQEQLLTAFGTAGDAVRGVYDVLRTAWQQYRHERIRHAASALVDKVEPRSQWPYERIRSAAESGQRAMARPGEGLPYVPEGFAWDDPGWQAAHLAREDAWSWGDKPAVGVVESVAAALRSALSVASPAPELAADVLRLSVARRRVGEAVRSIHQVRRVLVDDVWLTDPYLRGLDPGERYWEARVVAYAHAMGLPFDGERTLLEDRLPERAGRAAALDRLCAPTRGGGAGGRVRAAVLAAVGLLLDVRPHLENVARDLAGDVSRLPAWNDFLFSGAREGEPVDARHRVLLRLLALDGATRLMAQPTTTGSNLPVRLAELSLRVDHPWAYYSRTPRDKAAGMELARFGGFLKRSWRVNDWMWGRLDAATMLTQVVLDPDRMRRLLALARSAPREFGLDPALARRSRMDATLDEAFDVGFARTTFDALRSALYGQASSSAVPGLDTLEEEAWQEWRDAIVSAEPIRTHLPQVARWAALPRQVDVVLEEFPALVAAIEVDCADGFSPRSRGALLVAELRDDPLLRLIAAQAAAAQASRTMTSERLALGWRVLQIFDRAGIGREDLAQEMGSDALLRTGAEALGTFVTVADTDLGRHAAIKPVTAALRGAMLLPYWMIRGVAAGGGIGRFAALGALVVGGMTLVLSLLGVLGGASATVGLVGGAAVLAGFAYAAAKSGSVLHAVALLAPVGPLVAYALASRGALDGAAAASAATRVLVIAVAVAALMLLGLLPWPLRSPLKTLADDAPAAGRRLVSWLARAWPWVLGVALVVAAAVRWWGPSGRALHRGVSRLVGQPWYWQLLITIAVVGAGLLIAYYAGLPLRRWRASVLRDVVPADDGTSVQGTFVRGSLDHPTGVAATWLPVYGAGYLAAAIVFGWLCARGGTRTLQGWETFTLWWLAAVGVVLCLVGPLLATYLAWRAIRRRITADGAGARSQQDLLVHLINADLAYAALVAEPLGAQPRGTRLHLTGAGKALAAGSARP